MGRTRAWANRIPSIAALVVLLLAFALRVYGLDVQSFAFDEGWTSYAIHHSWSEMWGVLAPDNHPPLYYVLVKAFADVAGYDDFPVRFASVMAGTVLIALLFALSRRLGGEIAGLSSALFAACSPLFVYYAQEARMYSLLMALALLSSYGAVRLSSEPTSRRWWAAYVLAACGALYTHYFAVLLLLAQNLVALAWLVNPPGGRGPGARGAGSRLRVRWLGLWSLGQGAILLLYLPWLPTAMRQISVGQGTWWRVPLPAVVILKDVWRFYVLGPRRPAGVPVVGVMLGGTALALAVALLLGYRRRLAAWFFAVATFLVPVALIVLIGNRLPVYTDRYALVAAPGLPLAVGIGVAACWDALRASRARPAWSGGVAAMALLAAAIAGPLQQLYDSYTDPAYWREDFRRAAQYIMETSGRGDAVVLVGAYQPIMQYYRGDAAVVRFPAQRDSVQDEMEVVAALNGAIRRESQVRLVMYSWPTVDPQGLVEGLLRAQCRLQGEHWQRETGVRPIKVLNFEGCETFAREPRQPLEATFGDQVVLSAYRLIHFVPGTQAHVALWWRALRRPERNYSAFVHLVGADGAIVTQYDHLPLSDFYPMQAWPTGVEHRDDYPLNLSADVDLEGAWLAIGLYDRSSKVRLPAFVDGKAVGDFVRVALE